MVATLEKVWGSASWSPGHTGDQNQGPPFPECFSHPPGATQSAVGLWTRSTPGGQSLQARAARRGGGTLRRRLGVGWRTPGPAPRALAAGWPGSPASRTYMWSQPLPPSGKQPVPSVDGREVGVTPLASSALPQTEDLSALGKLPQLHVAVKEVALQSVPGLVAL